MFFSSLVQVFCSVYDVVNPYFPFCRINILSDAGPTMRSLYLLLIPALLLLSAIPVSRGRYNDDFDDGEDLADFDDNDFAEFEDMTDDSAAEAETAPPPRASPSLQPDEDEDEDEATVELEDGQDGFEDPDTQVYYLLTLHVSFTSVFEHSLHTKSCLFWFILFFVFY